MDKPLTAMLAQARDLLTDGRSLRACLVINSRGSTPQTAGALMLVDDAAQTVGTIGGGCVEADVRRQAMAMLTDGRTGVMQFKLDHDYGWDDGLICGGTLVVAIAHLPDATVLTGIIEYIEQRQPTSLDFSVEHEGQTHIATLHVPVRSRLLIAGCGHVGQALARIAGRLDDEVILVDDRADMLQRFTPEGTTTKAGDIAQSLAEADIDAHTDCVIVTRGHRHDEQALEAVIDRGARYVGMIGSRRKVKLIKDDLRHRGVNEAALDAVHAPIGLDIGAVSVEEIAIAIAAELVEVRRARPFRTVDVPDALLACAVNAS
jgi:xanthine dehydrogenase accessory factor